MLEHNKKHQLGRIKKTNMADPPMTPAVSKETNLVAYYSSRQRHNPVIVCVTVIFLKETDDANAHCK